MWRQESNPITKQPEYVWEGFENGIGDSPYTGISFMSGFNIKNYAKVGYSNIARSASTMTGGAPSEEIISTLQDPNNLSNLYSVTIAGVVRQSLNYGQTWNTNATSPAGITEATGMFIWGQYLHVIGGTGGNDHIYVIVIGSSGTTGAWTDMQDNPSGTGTAPIFNATAQNKQQNHYALYCTFDKKVYICNGNWVSSLTPGIAYNTGATVTYNPIANNTSYTWNETALKLNAVSAGSSSYTQMYANYLEQLQDKLLISQGNLILPWDRVSLHYDTPFPLSENIGKMININNIIYVFGGVPLFTAGNVIRSVVAGRGSIFYYNGFNGGYFRKIPDSLNISNFINEPEWLIGGLMSFQTKVFFGAIGGNGSPNFAGGVYSMDISSETQAIQYQTAPSPLTIETTASSTKLYTALYTTQNKLLNSNILNYSGGYTNTNGTTYAYDYTDQAGNREQGDLTTDIMQVGTKLNPNTFSQIEVRFRNPLAVGETVLVEARNYFNGNVGSNSTYTYTAPANSTELSFSCPVIMQANEELSIRLVTTPIADTSGGTGIPIKQIRLISNTK